MNKIDGYLKIIKTLIIYDIFSYPLFYVISLYLKLFIENWNHCDYYAEVSTDHGLVNWIQNKKT